MSRKGEQILLSGPPGVGKSAIARQVAKLSGRQLVDLDDLITSRNHRTPAEIIRENGESRFRELEAEALEQLDPQFGVVALGGGTLTTDRGRTAARSRGLIFSLEAEISTLRTRLKGSGGDRPLLDQRGASDPIESMISARRTTYAMADKSVSAEAAPDAVAAEIIREANSTHALMTQIGDKSSRIVIGRNLADAATGAVCALAPTRPCLVIADQGPSKEHRARYVDALKKHYPTIVIEVPGGEDVKTWSFLGNLLGEALTQGCGRQSVVIGLGGGATCDLAAMVAALLGRGAPLVLVPTTVVAQTDASVGGKAAINLDAGRNLVGVFHAATDVVIDLDFLDTLDAAEYRAGLAEVLKMGIIGDPKLFAEIVQTPRLSVSQVERVIRQKADIVEQDPIEKGIRKVLNLGHTLGHALEMASQFGLRHGEAVAIGMAAVTRLSAERGWLDIQTRDVIIDGIQRIDLPVTASADVLSKADAYIGRDKKSDSKHVDLIAVRDLGRVSVERVELVEIVPALVRAGGAL